MFPLQGVILNPSCLGDPRHNTNLKTIMWMEIVDGDGDGPVKTVGVKPVSKSNADPIGALKRGETS